MKHIKLFLIFSLLLLSSIIYGQCAARTSKGKPCKIRTKNLLCHVHSRECKRPTAVRIVKPIYPCKATTKAGQGCKKHALYGENYCSIHKRN